MTSCTASSSAGTYIVPDISSVQKFCTFKQLTSDVDICYTTRDNINIDNSHTINSCNFIQNQCKYLAETLYNIELTNCVLLSNSNNAVSIMSGTCIVTNCQSNNTILKKITLGDGYVEIGSEDITLDFGTKTKPYENEPFECLELFTEGEIPWINGKKRLAFPLKFLIPLLIQ